MKVKYLGKVDTLALEKGKVYDVISVENGWFRIMTEQDEDYLFPPEHFEIIEDMIKVKYIGENDPLSLLNGKVYDARILKKGWYGIVDETNEEYAYPPEHFEIIEE